jgi:hypothetical protein
MEDNDEVVFYWKKQDTNNYRCYLAYERDVCDIEAGRLYVWDSAPNWPTSNRAGALYYTGKRWLVWATSVLVAAETEYTDVNDPPKFMVESLAEVR